jgi:3-hydroxybutyryl-CoA dehydrogenase
MQCEWHIGIIGSGKMGTNIVEYLISLNVHIVWITHTVQSREEKKARIEKKLNRMVRFGELNVESGESKKKEIEITCDLSALGKADLIIECVTEELETKQKLFSAVHASVNESVILLSNTSSLPLYNIFEPISNLERCAGLHFIYPVQLKSMVEINLLSQNTVSVVTKIKDFVRFIKRKSVILQETDHFALNKLYFLYFAQAFRIVKAGLLSVEEIESLVEERLFAIGPFRFIESVGIEIIRRSVRQYIKIPAELKFCDPWLSSMDTLIKNNNSGRETVAGFCESSLFRNLTKNKTENWYRTEDDKKKHVLLLLKSVFVNSFFIELGKGHTDSKTLLESVNEYMGLKEGSVEFLQNSELQIIENKLKSMYSQTSEDVYKPASMLVEWARRDAEKAAQSGESQ